MDFEAARDAMVEGQIRPSDVTRREIIEAFRAVPREPFAPAPLRALAYADLALEVAPGRRMLEPRVLAKMLQAAAIRKGELVLDVGCASGYSAMIVSRLAGFVAALEQDDALADQAAAHFARFELENVSLERGRLAAGAPEAGPYDVILLEGATETPPEPLFAQLKEGGRLLGVEGGGPIGSARIWRKAGGVISGVRLFEASALVLPGFDAAPAFEF